MIELIKEDDDSNILSTDHSLNVPLHYEVSSIRVPECFENVKLIFQMLALQLTFYQHHILRMNLPRNEDDRVLH